MVLLSEDFFIFTGFCDAFVSIVLWEVACAAIEFKLLRMIAPGFFMARD